MDKYDEQIERLTRDPDQIYESWNAWGVLFASVTAGPLRVNDGSEDARACGCLTLIKRHPDLYSAVGPNGEALEALNAEIIADPEIPTEANQITPAHLPRFAYWQRRLDKELRGL